MAVLIILNSAGFVIVYFQLKNTFQKNAFIILENISEIEGLTTIVLPLDEFENEDEKFHFVESNEVEYFGKMYDIFRIDYSGDSVKIIALCDEKEDNLNELFEKFFTKNLNDKYSNTASIINLIISDAGLPVEFNGISSWREDVCYSFIFVPIFKNLLDIPTPPPKDFS